MTTMEILMLVGGLAAFVISFFLPDGTAAEAGEGISQEELQQLFDDEVEISRQRIDDMTKETLDYSMEKTERSLEKIANEKIMAVGEYSDTVLDQINQSHNQVVFLSDMLRKSKDELTELLNRADRTSKDANERANEAYDLAGNAMKLAEDAAERAEEAGRTAVSAEEKMIDARRIMQGTERKDAINAINAEIPEEAEEVELPAEIFEGLVTEFSLEDGSEETEPEDSGVVRRGAEERLAESLSAFRNSLKENEEADELDADDEDAELSAFEDLKDQPFDTQDQEEGDEVFGESGDADGEGFQTLDTFFGNETGKAAETGTGDVMGLSGQELREMGLQAKDGRLQSVEEPQDEVKPEIDLQPEMEVPAEDPDDAYAGMTEEEKMEALLRAATQELAQDVSAVTGISEMHWEPAEEEVTEEISEDAGREAKARALEALKDEAESEYRENKAKALEALKAEAELAAMTAAEEEMAPAEDAEFLQSLLKDDAPADFGSEDMDETEPEAVEAVPEESDPMTEENAPAVPKKAAHTKKAAESEEEYPDQMTIEAVMKEFDQMAAEAENGEDAKKEAASKKTSARKTTAKKTAKNSGNGSRKRASKKNEQTGTDTDGVSLQFAPGEETTKNNNDRILEMHRMGRSDMAIAKDLGMGIGEVKLIIALNEIS